MTASIPSGAASGAASIAHPPSQLAGHWELGVLALMAVLYLGGIFLNPAFFGKAEALSAVLRDAARIGVMAVGMSFVIVNKDLDLSVGSTNGFIAVVFATIYAPTHYDLGIGAAIVLCLLLGTLIGLINGVLVTYLRVPAFIATLTMLFIGRGLVLGMTGGKTISFATKALGDPWFFAISENNAFGFNNQILILLGAAIVGALVLAKTRWGYETFATGGNEQAATYAGINTRWIRIRAYIISALCATVAGLMSEAQDKGVTSQYGLGAELVVIAAVIVGGASILGGRGRVIGSVLGAILTVLIDKVLREGVSTVRTVKIGDVDMQVQAMSQLPAGAVPAFLGLLLVGAVLIEPWIIRRKVIPRLWARLRGRPALDVHDAGGVAIEGAQTKGAVISDRALTAKNPLQKFLARRDAPAMMIAAILWLAGLYLRPDYWWHVDNTFALLLNFTEVGLLTIGLTYVIANGDIDLSVGAVLALSASTAAILMKSMGVDPWIAVVAALLVGSAAGTFNAVLTVRFGLPSFVATLGMFYIGRGLGAWFVAGNQLTGFPEKFNLLGRKLIDILAYFNLEPGPGLPHDLAAAISVQTLWLGLVALIAGIVLARTPWGQMIYATGGNRRAADYAGINTNRVRFLSLLGSSFCAAMAGVIYVAFYRSFNPTAGQLRELDAIAAVIIGGGSIFGGYGTIVGSIAGAAVITLIRALLQLQIITSSGQSLVLPQHWVNVFIGVILIAAVLGDIWLRQSDLPATIRRRLARLKSQQPGATHV